MTQPKTAKVYDLTPAQLRRQTERQQPAQTTATIFDDLADGIEAIHQLCNLAGFSERPREFIFDLTTLAHNARSEFVELFDEELAQLRGCSTKTVQRHRKGYQKEAEAKRFGFVEIIEGDYDKSAVKNVPTRYRFHVGGQIAEAVALARRAEGWQGMSRRRQREEIARACEEVFHTIPDARRQGRKRRRPRLAEDEIETCMKVAASKLKRARELASKLSEHSRAELLDEDTRGLRRRWLEMRAEMDALFGDSAQVVEDSKVDAEGGQIVHPPAETSELVRASNKNTRTEAAPESEAEVEPTPEVVSAWGSIEERLTKPLIQSAELVLVAESPPRVPDDDERAERAAILEFEGNLERGEADERALDELLE